MKNQALTSFKIFRKFIFFPLYFLFYFRLWAAHLNTEDKVFLFHPLSLSFSFLSWLDWLPQILGNVHQCLEYIWLWIFLHTVRRLDPLLTGASHINLIISVEGRLIGRIATHMKSRDEKSGEKYDWAFVVFVHNCFSVHKGLNGIWKQWVVSMNLEHNTVKLIFLLVAVYITDSVSVWSSKHRSLSYDLRSWVTKPDRKSSMFSPRLQNFHKSHVFWVKQQGHWRLTEIWKSAKFYIQCPNQNHCSGAISLLLYAV